MNEASRTQGWAIVIGAGVLGFLFLLGILNGSYWAIALPVAILVFFVLGLAGWVGFTIATVQVEPEAAPEILATDAPAARTPVEPAASEASSSAATGEPSKDPA